LLAAIDYDLCAVGNSIDYLLWVELLLVRIMLYRGYYKGAI